MEADPTPRRRRTILLLVAVAMLNLPAIAVAGHHLFDDVPDTHNHAAGIHYVSEAGITSGCAPNAYCPGNNLTRAQMATFLHAASGNRPGTAASVNAARVSAGAVTTESSQNTVANAISNTHSVSCPAGTVVVGGGGLSNIANLWVIEDSRPIGSQTWSVRYTKRDGVAGNQTATVFARCLRVGQ